MILFLSMVKAFPNTVDSNSCGLDPESGEPRKPGDSWREDCNRCQCLPNIQKGCTKRLCQPSSDEVSKKKEVIELNINMCGVDEGTGKERKAGESWQVDCNTCNCFNTSLPPACTLALCPVPDLPKAFEESSCGTDPDTGLQRQPGDSWKEDCNRCRCLPNLEKGCTKRLCQEPIFSKEELFPKKEDTPKNLCGVDEETGEERKAGDSWSVSCNTCSCFSTNLPPACTLQMCANFDLSKAFEEPVLEDERTGIPGNTANPSPNLCGVDPESGKEREVGESWKDDCNTCQCFDKNVPPACTFAFCIPEVTIEEEPRNKCGLDKETGEEREAGDTWKEDCNTCHCANTTIPPACTFRFCLPANETIRNIESVESCGTDPETGLTRNLGDAWQEECNRCRCIGDGKPACTKRLCTVPQDSDLEEEITDVKSGGSTENLCGYDSVTGKAREKGESWKDDCNTCVCLDPSRPPGCTFALCPPNYSLKPNAGVKFPGSSNKSSCTDNDGNTRLDGEIWDEDCNTCRCKNGGTSCTEVFCGSGN